VVAGRIGLTAADGCEWRVNDSIERRSSFFNGVRIDVNLEGAADLAKSLRRAIKFGVLKTVAPDHGLDLAGGILDSQERRLRRGLLLELNAGRCVAQFLNGKLRQVADFEEFRRFFAANPGEIRSGKNRAVRPNLYCGTVVVESQNKPSDICTFVD